MLYSFMNFVKIDFYDQIARLSACTIIALIYLLAFYFGYKMAPLGWWWAGFVIIGVYVWLVKIINKPFFK